MSSRRLSALAAAVSILCSSCATATSTAVPSTIVPSAPPPVAASPSAAGGPACPTPAAALIPEPAAPWWKDRVFYEVFVRSFADSDGDGIGDLRGLTQRLDYLNDGDASTTDDLGVTTDDHVPTGPVR